MVSLPSHGLDFVFDLHCYRQEAMVLMSAVVSLTNSFFLSQVLRSRPIHNLSTKSRNTLVKATLFVFAISLSAPRGAMQQLNPGNQKHLRQRNPTLKPADNADNASLPPETLPEEAPKMGHSAHNTKNDDTNYHHTEAGSATTMEIRRRA